ncbi:RasGEF domain protein, partial [Teladorsagia circumcincta]
GSSLLDRKGEGSYEESSVVRRGPLAVGPHPVLPPRKHVVEYMQVIPMVKSKLSECRIKKNCLHISESAWVTVPRRSSEFRGTSSLFAFIFCLFSEELESHKERKRLLDRIVTPKPTPATVSKLTPPRKSHTLFDFRSSDLACQMTYIDAQLFHLIEPPELLWWAQEQDEMKSPNLVAFTEHFNNVSFWVRTLVITPSNPKEREKYMMKFIKIMKQLRRLGNFNSYLALLSALVSSPLARLDWNKTVTDALREHTDIMDTGHSYKNYRLLLQQATPPTVPYM